MGPVWMVMTPVPRHVSRVLLLAMADLVLCSGTITLIWGKMMIWSWVVWWRRSCGYGDFMFSLWDWTWFCTLWGILYILYVTLFRMIVLYSWCRVNWGTNLSIVLYYVIIFFASTVRLGCLPCCPFPLGMVWCGRVQSAIEEKMLLWECIMRFLWWNKSCTFYCNAGTLHSLLCIVVVISLVTLFCEFPFLSLCPTLRVHHALHHILILEKNKLPPLSNLRTPTNFVQG